MNLVKYLKNRYSRFAILDPEDNSITLSRRIVRDFSKNEKTFLFAFRVDSTFGFSEATLELIESSQCGELQYNAQHKCFGFACLCPTVNLMLQEKNLPYSRIIVSVRRKRVKHLTIYKLCL